MDIVVDMVQIGVFIRYHSSRFFHEIGSYGIAQVAVVLKMDHMGFMNMSHMVFIKILFGYVSSRCFYADGSSGDG